MIQLSRSHGLRPTSLCAADAAQKQHRRRVATVCTLAAWLVVIPAAAQVVTIDSHTGVVTNGSFSANASIDRRYRQITPTNVPLTKSELDPKTRLELIRLLQSEQGFAMRPFPRGHKGLTLVANGKLEPAGESYLSMVTSEGLSAKPGDRVVLTDIKFDHSKIVFDLNGGPDPKHRILRHIQLGTGPQMSPVVQGDDGQEPVGARLSLNFEGHVPELTGSDVKALLAPLISFDVKTPVQAFTDTLPTQLKDAILNHHVLVGMSTDMVLFAKGQPEGKSREMDGQMPFEEWIYGKPPQEVDFVRINGNRVIRVEIAKTGEALVIFDKDVVEGLMRTDGTPLEANVPSKNTQLGDVERNPDTQATGPSPSLRNPGEKLPSDDPSGARVGEMRPVQFPKPKPADPTDPNASQPAQTGEQTTPTSASAPANGQTQPATQTPADEPSAPAQASPPPPSKPSSLLFPARS
jgi:hypothetical protein